MVEIDMNGRMEVTAVRIAQEAKEDTDMLQDFVMAAFTNCMEKIREVINREMSAMTGGLNIPGLPGFPGGFPGA